MVRFRFLSAIILLVAGCTSGPDEVRPVIGNLSWPTSGYLYQGFYGEERTSSIFPTYYYDEKNSLQFWNGLKHFHRGVDIDNTEGVVVCAAADGTAKVYLWDGKSKDYGNHIVIDHGKDLYTLYAHLRAVKIKDGQVVKRNELIGEMGTTGNSTGPHLHFEVRHDPNHTMPILVHYIPGTKGDQVVQGKLIPFNY